MNDDSRVLVIGASAGGFEALRTILNGLPADLNAAVLIVLHTQSLRNINFIKSMQQSSNLKLQFAENGAALNLGVVYFAIRDCHLIIREGKTFLSKGPTENLARPAIDPLFRTAAAAYGNRVIGIVLSGMLSDGTSGLYAIKACNGLIGVQDPNEAAYPEMPVFALRSLTPDFCCGISRMAETILKQMAKPLPPAIEIPKHIKQEAGLSYSTASNIELENELGSKVALGCPDCGGPLWRMNNDEEIDRYRCHTGHGYTDEALEHSKQKKIEESLWIALRVLEEKLNLHKRALLKYENGKSKFLLESTRKKIKETQENISTIRQAINIEPPSPDLNAFPLNHSATC